MSVNRFQPHVLVRPEDESTRRIQILPVAGGWHKVLDSFLAEDAPGLETYDNRLMALLIDLDDDRARVQQHPRVCCRDGTDTTWKHELLIHNVAELERLLPLVRPILFG